MGVELICRFGLQPLLDRSNLPDLVVFLNPREVAHGVRECTLRNIPTVGVVDSDTDPRFVTYPIPANVQVGEDPFNRQATPS